MLLKCMINYFLVKNIHVFYESQYVSKLQHTYYRYHMTWMLIIILLFKILHGPVINNILFNNLKH